ncbi:MAG TPA: phosphoribosylanthranilate isomerase [Planctomycetales bacterium]|jgi:phosphoribosylanthranilate isomerase|nr:phosphoribosylanthranilate isomerase [Planctomycetales bacterium]
MSYHLRIKICGITRPADAREAGRLGADAVGLNFFEGSPRRIDSAAVEDVLAELPPFVEAVGVFVNRPLGEAFAFLETWRRIRVVQWHGENCGLGDGYPHRLIPAFPVRDISSLAVVTSYIEACRSLGRVPAAVLLDGHAPGQHGGTGRIAPWELIAAFRPGVPVILAGGLTSDNVAEAVRIVRPYAVDVASGVESAPGHKDAEKMRRFIAAAYEAAAKINE